MAFSEKFKSLWNFIFVPTSIKPLTYVLRIENVLCLYRNISFYRNLRYRILIYMRVFLEVATAVACLVVFSDYFLPVVPSFTSIPFYMNISNSIYIVLVSLYHSKRFSKILLLIEANDLYFTNDEEYRKNLDKVNRRIKYCFFMYSLSMITLDIIVCWKKVCVTISRKDIVIFCSINRIVANYRCVFEYVVLYCILCVLSEQIKCITRALTKSRISIAVINEQSNIEESFSDSTIEIREFGELSNVYSKIKDCCKLFNRIFGHQLILMLGMSTIYCIMFLYRMAFISVKGYPDAGSLVVSVINLSLFFILLLMLSWSAQRKQNNVTELRQQLGKLLINYSTDGPSYKATKDLLRLVSTRSVCTETFGSIPVDMTLIPSFIMFITSYTVIALQFNNIV